MLLYVMRHGPAEDRAATGRDFDRVLTPEGRAVVARAAQAFHRAHASTDREPAPSPGPLRPLRLLSSPYARARQTAELVAAAAPLGPHAPEVELHDDLAADEGLPLSLVNELAAAGTDALLVGHQPIVEELVRALLHPLRSPLSGGFRTATIVAIEREPAPRGSTSSAARWRPAWVLDPHQPGG